MKKDLYIDFDGVISNTIKTICHLYNQDYFYHDGFKMIDENKIETWEFKELSCATRYDINKYFNSYRFFHEMFVMDNAIEVIKELSKEYNIKVISMSNDDNEKYKRIWLGNHFDFHFDFIAIDFNIYKDKSHIDMKNAVFIDDSYENLNTSNAEIKICFGNIYEWNCKWTGHRCFTWNEVKKKLKGRRNMVNKYTIRFYNIDNLTKFINIVDGLESDFIIIKGNICIDGKSKIGALSLDVTREYDLIIIEKRTNETRELLEFLKEEKIILED